MKEEFSVKITGTPKSIANVSDFLNQKYRIVRASGIKNNDRDNGHHRFLTFLEKESEEKG